MRLELTILSGNQAVTDESGRLEVARILRDAADKVEHGATDVALFDYNGNDVGRLEVEW